MIPARLAIPVSCRPIRTACNPAVLFLFLALFAALLALPVRSDGSLRILAIGDSLTAGYGLEQGDGLVPQLQRWLDANGAAAVEVVNMGASGDTTAGGRARLDWVLTDGADAVILALGANDMLRGIEPTESRGNLDAMLATLNARGLPVLLIGMEAPRNYGPGYKDAFDAIYPELAWKYGILLDSHFLAGLVDEPTLFQDDGLHPNAAGVAMMVDRLGPIVLDLIARVER
jgi:acyl-CoA thioesterase-1